MASQLASQGNALSKLQRDVSRIKPRSTSHFGLFVGSLKRVRGDYLECYPYDETSETLGLATVIVAKQFRHRKSWGTVVDPTHWTVTVMDVVHTYTYADNYDAYGINNHTRTDDTASVVPTEQQRIIPPWVLGDVIYAVPFPTITVWNGRNDGNGTPVIDADLPDDETVVVRASLLHLESRQWAKFA